MVPDAEIISLLSTVLSRIDVGEYTIKVCDTLLGWVSSTTLLTSGR